MRAQAMRKIEKRHPNRRKTEAIPTRQSCLEFNSLALGDWALVILWSLGIGRWAFA